MISTSSIDIINLTLHMTNALGYETDGDGKIRAGLVPNGFLRLTSFSIYVGNTIVEESVPGPTRLPGLVVDAKVSSLQLQLDCCH
jgi:hypothetical protein